MLYLLSCEPETPKFQQAWAYAVQQAKSSSVVLLLLQAAVSAVKQLPASQIPGLQVYALAEDLAAANLQAAAAAAGVPALSYKEWAALSLLHTRTLAWH
jgi:sulfur relay protein TusB/DsrH